MLLAAGADYRAALPPASRRCSSPSAKARTDVVQALLKAGVDVNDSHAATKVPERQRSRKPARAADSGR